MALEYGKAGSGALHMAQRRHFIYLLLAVSLVGYGLFWLFNFDKLVGVGIGGSLAFLLITVFLSKRIEKVALHIKKRAKDAERGAQAEILVADILNALPSGFHAFHDIPTVCHRFERFVARPPALPEVFDRGSPLDCDASGPSRPDSVMGIAAGKLKSSDRTMTPARIEAEARTSALELFDAAKPLPPSQPSHRV